MHRFLILMSLLPGAVWPATIYDNGVPNQFDASEMTSFLQAEDFTLSVTSVFISIRFWTLEDASSFSGSILWEIRSDSNGAPASILFSASAVPTRTPTGLTGFSLDEFVYTLDIPVISLDPGTYWLALHNGPITNDGGAQMFWESTDANTSVNLGQEFFLPGGTWNSNSLEHAFQLLNSDVPEPGTLPLGLGALAALAVARRLLANPGDGNPNRVLDR